MALLVTLLTIAGSYLVHCQSPGNHDTLECQMAEEAFKETIVCQIAYGDIVDERGCEFGRDRVLCNGECGERARAISCTCGDGNLIVSNIGQLCNCESNITCSRPMKTDNCSKAAYAFDKECGDTYSTLINPSNNSCSTCCTTLCNSPCNKLTKNITCYCPEMSEEYQIIRNIDSMCECSVEHCNSSASDLLLSPWILMLLLTISVATQWILGWIS